MTAPTRKRGRKPRADARRHVRDVRLSDEELATLERAATAAGQPLRTYVRDAALSRAREGAPTIADAIDLLERVDRRLSEAPDE